MRKLRLELEELVVESFRVQDDAEGRGTVKGNADTVLITDVVSFLLFGTCDVTCAESCKGTCNATCDNTCAATCPASCAGAVPTGCNLPYCHANPTTKPIGAAEYQIGYGGEFNY